MFSIMKKSSFNLIFSLSQFFMIFAKIATIFSDFYFGFHVKHPINFHKYKNTTHKKKYEKKNIKK